MVILRKINPEKICLEHIFNTVEIHSDYLRIVVAKVLAVMAVFTDITEIGFDVIREARTFSREDAEVTEDGDIILDSDELKKYDEDVTMAIIAHEFAHYALGHFRSWRADLKYEYEADNQAIAWGFNMAKFRHVCGSPTIEGGQQRK